MAGPQGKAKVVAKGMISGIELQTLPGVPGRWGVTEAGGLTVTAALADGVVVEEKAVDGTADVPPGSHPKFPTGRTGSVSGADGTYALVVMDESAVARSGLREIVAYPYDPAWVLEGEYRAAPPGRVIDVERLTVPRTEDSLPAPVDLVVTIDGEEYVLAVLEDLPGRRLVIFTDETNGDGTPEIGRWLLLPLLGPGSTVPVDFNRTTLSQHHFSPSVFTCPLSPPGNHLPMRIEAGERALAYDKQPEGSDTVNKDKAIRYLRNLETRDFASARSMCSATATVWHNDGKGEETTSSARSPTAPPSCSSTWCTWPRRTVCAVKCTQRCISASTMASLPGSRNTPTSCRATGTAPATDMPARSASPDRTRPPMLCTPEERLHPCPGIPMNT
ncbi:DUF1684 domain-containing protein [Nocardia sp. NEAU-G5]|uniref:DUF1684 domain-containing protein n=1 Tax=Nocardia albiluteola TaxID=2842303 RepID=A0ABS6BAK0_9NOCA|nr:DUF1684 domain-containing protein [Nocardia albiluteola]MBU3067327.1 DUF1684 domain-containing protein [Nocardia albiluteola]